MQHQWQSFGPKYDDPGFRKVLANDFRRMKEIHVKAAKELGEICRTL